MAGLKKKIIEEGEVGSLSTKEIIDAYGLDSLVVAFIEQPEGNISFPYLMGMGGMNIKCANIHFWRSRSVETGYRDLVTWANNNFRWAKITAFGRFLTVHLRDAAETKINFKINWTKRSYFQLKKAT